MPWQAPPIPKTEDCEGCHADVAQQWRGSMHAKAWFDPMFQRALAHHEDTSRCQGCHAPESEPTAAPTAAAAHAGVGCVSCHQVTIDGAVRSRGDGASAAHPVTTDASFGGPATCTGCHEFDLPGTEGLRAPVQSTGTEHAASRFADADCIDCHMPKVKTPFGSMRSHAFTASGDPQMLARAVRVEAWRENAGRIRLDLEPGVVGHAFPTGEIHRRLRVVVQAHERDGRVVTTAERTLARHVVRDPQGRWVEVADDRVGAPGLPDGRVELGFDLGRKARNDRVTWTLLYERLEEPGIDGQERVTSSLPVASGSL